LTSVCNGDNSIHTTPGQRLCVENDTTCHTDAPQSSSHDDGFCLSQVRWDVYPFAGSCADFDAYNRNDGERDCLPPQTASDVSLGCPPDGVCVDFKCICGGMPCPAPTPPGGVSGQAGAGGTDPGAGGGAGSGAATSSDAGTPTPPAPPAPPRP
jgi:hypothetical protein